MIEPIFTRTYKEHELHMIVQRFVDVISLLGLEQGMELNILEAKLYYFYKDKM